MFTRSEYWDRFINSNRFFEGEGEGGGGGGAGGEKPAAEAEKVVFTDAQQAAINRMLKEERESATKKATDAATEAADKAKKAADDAAALADTEKKGEYETAKAALEKKVTEAEADAASHKARADRYETLVVTQIEALKKELPAEAIKGLKADAPVLDQLEWLTERKALLDDLKPLMKKGEEKPKLPKTPQGEGGEHEDDPELEKAARERQSFSYKTF